MYNAFQIRYRKGDKNHVFQSPLWKNGDASQRLIAERQTEINKTNMNQAGARVVELNVIRIPGPPNNE